MASAGAGLLAGWMTAGVIGAASKFEQFQIVLENTEGSASAARRAMQWVEDFAVKTPFELGQVMEAFKQLRVLDFSPMTGTLEAIGNASSAMGRDIMDTVDAVASAAAGEYEPLRRYGVRISKQGDQLTLLYRKNGREFRKSIRDNQAELERAITTIFNERFPKMMDRQSRSFAGLWANITDNFGKFQRMIANAGFFDWAKGKLEWLLNKLQELEANGTLQRWAKKISKWLERAGQKLWDFAVNTDWKKVGSDITSVANAIMRIANAVNRVSDAIDRAKPRLEMLRSLPIVGALVTVGQSVAAAAGRQSQATPQARGKFAPGYNSLGRIVPQLKPNGVPLRKRDAPPSLFRQTTDIRQQLDIRIRTDRGVDARPTRMVSSDRRAVLNVSRGWMPTA